MEDERCTFWYGLCSFNLIPQEVFVLHSLHCQRHLYRCALCCETLPRTKKAKHEREAHNGKRCCSRAPSREPCEVCNFLGAALDFRLHVGKCLAKRRPRACALSPKKYIKLSL